MAITEKTLTVFVPGTPDSRYPIHIGAGFLASLWEAIETGWPNIFSLLFRE